jgi:predicted nucleotidyltransferase
MVKREIIIAIKKYRAVLIRRGIRVKKMILYGSFAKGSAHAASDIDIAVVSPDFGNDRFEEGGMLFELAQEIDARIEPVPISLNAFKNDTWIPLIYEIKSTGIDLSRLH